MAWDHIWEETYQRREWGRYPNEELVRFMARNYASVADRGSVKVLEVGCGGSGSNLWAMARQGYSPYGMDGSPTGIAKAKARLAEEGVSVDLRVGEALGLSKMYEPNTFDAVVDVACLQCNPIGEAAEIVRQMAAITKPGGKVFSMILTDDCAGVGRGTQVEPGTFTDISVGPLQGTGLNHFYTLDEIRSTFAPFAPLGVEVVSRTYLNREISWKSWIVTGSKAA